MKSIESKMQVARNEYGRWEVGFIAHDGVLAFEPDSLDFPTKKEAEDNLKWLAMQDAACASSERRHEYMIAYACGERD